MKDVTLQPVCPAQREAQSLILLPRRRVVERTVAWITPCRRLNLDDERLTESSDAMMSTALTRLMVRRLAAA